MTIRPRTGAPRNPPRAAHPVTAPYERTRTPCSRMCWWMQSLGGAPAGHVAARPTSGATAAPVPGCASGLADSSGRPRTGTTRPSPGRSPPTLRNVVPASDHRTVEHRLRGSRRRQSLWTTPSGCQLMWTIRGPQLIRASGIVRSKNAGRGSNSTNHFDADYPLRGRQAGRVLAIVERMRPDGETPPIPPIPPSPPSPACPSSSPRPSRRRR